MEATLKVSAVYYNDGLLELSWEDIETGETAWLELMNVDEKKGREITSVVLPCVYHGALVSQDNVEKEE